MDIFGHTIKYQDGFINLSRIDIYSFSVPENYVWSLVEVPENEKTASSEVCGIIYL